MSEPLTDYIRRIWKESAEDVLKYPDHRHRAIQPIPHARERLRYDATLQAKDAQIEQLVTALRALMEATRSDYDYYAHVKDDPDIFAAAQEAKAAIKEATNGS